MMMMMRGMTAKSFDPIRYSGRWFEVASLKRGFAGQGQEDCHCTQVCDTCEHNYIFGSTFQTSISSTHDVLFLLVILSSSCYGNQMSCTQNESIAIIFLGL